MKGGISRMIKEWLMVGVEFGISAFAAVTMFGVLLFATLGVLSAVIALFKGGDDIDSQP